MLRIVRAKPQTASDGLASPRRSLPQRPPTRKQNRRPASTGRRPWSFRGIRGVVRLSVRRGARPDLLRLAGILYGFDLADHLLEQTAVLHDHFGQVLVHDDIAGFGIDQDRAAR